MAYHTRVEGGQYKKVIGYETVYGLQPKKYIIRQRPKKLNFLTKKNMQLSSQQQAPKREKAKCPNMQLAEMGTRAKHKSVADQNPKRPHTPTTNILTQQSKNLNSRTKNNTNTHTEATACEKKNQ
jgi:hypothetical protein